ncbi:hypothetical protein B9479_006117 [Cryptococcus floricola]|uniref:Transcription activator of gluconeogenesis ERT1 n=1 Tax=Cryptococcus floricola TaxID=2591691 RepID=A0A5D3AT64_9TREE|nr:hypothetical protein B9479_006117 [Cryptococcus floricola]
MDYSSGSSTSSRQPFDGPGARSILGGDSGPPNMSQPQYASSSRSTLPQDDSSRDTATASPPPPAQIKRVGGKANVSSACGPCKRAHLACDVGRPCKRCINMGKQDQCEDVPHKKRGRPKVPRPALGEPYHRPPRANSSGDIGGVGKWRGPPVYEQPYMSGPGSYGPPMPRTGPSYEMESSHPAPSPYEQPFTLFTTTDFKILRASPSSFSLTGFHPNDFVNLNLLDWIHPHDKHLIDMERNRLLSVAPYGETSLTSMDVTQAAIAQMSELELLSPAEGMREPYPNKNLRVAHADGGYSPFNVRLHLGGGFGANLWKPATLARVYLVVSFLAIPRPPSYAPAQDIPPPNRRASQAGPLTPLTPIPTAPSATAPGPLPSFSSIAAGVEPPPQSRYDQPPLQQAYYPPPPPASMPRPGSSQSYSPYGRPGVPMPPAGYTSSRRTPSPPGPPSAYRTPQTAGYPPPPPVGMGQEYGMPAYGYPPAPVQGMQGQPPPGLPPPGADYRRASHDEWRGAYATDGRDGSGPSGSSISDGSRRAWEL